MDKICEFNEGRITNRGADYAECKEIEEGVEAYLKEEKNERYKYDKNKNRKGEGRMNQRKVIAKKHLKTVIIHKPSKNKADWFIPELYLDKSYVNIRESGRGVIQHGEELTDIIIRYYRHDKERFEKTRNFAEIQIGSSEKFIIDGIDLDNLAQDITDDIWDIIEARRIMRQANMGLKRIK